MRFIKYIIVLLILLVALYAIGWFYIAGKITGEINRQYTGQKISVQSLNKEEYFVTFNKVTSRGFPFEMAVGLEGWQEESRGALISYKSPVIMGYSFASQSVYIYYNGEIDAAYKPAEHNFGAILKIKDYLVSLSLPISRELLIGLKNMKDPVEMINYIRDLNISTKEVQIFDKQENELFYDKDHERLKFSFVPAKYYENLNDLLGDIPKEYTVDYLVKTKPVKYAARRIPVSLFYGFSILPSEFDATAHISAKTKAKTIQELYDNVEIAADIAFAGAKVKVSSLKLSYKGGLDFFGNTEVLIDSKIRLESGLFDELFAKYELVRPTVLAAKGGHLVNQEMSYIIANKDAFRFKDLENSDYELNLDMSSAASKVNSSIKLANFSIYSGESGFKLTNESVSRMPNKSNWHSKGLLLIKNYPAVVDFSSGYIYRFGKFRFLSDQARKLYIDVNKDFLKQISDYPTSTSNDLSFEYELDSNDLEGAKIGNAKISQIADLYQLMIYKKLFGAVDPHGDILGQMKKILPDLDENDPTFQKILPAITGKNLKELVPQSAQDAIKNSAPLKDLKKKIGKNLLK